MLLTIDVVIAHTGCGGWSFAFDVRRSLAFLAFAYCYASSVWGFLLSDLNWPTCNTSWDEISVKTRTCLLARCCYWYASNFVAHDGHMRAPYIGYMYRLDIHTHISMLGTLAQIRLTRQNKRFRATRTTCMCAVNARDVVLARCSIWRYRTLMCARHFLLSLHSFSVNDLKTLFTVWVPGSSSLHQFPFRASQIPTLIYGQSKWIFCQKVVHKEALHSVQTSHHVSVRSWFGMDSGFGRFAEWRQKQAGWGGRAGRAATGCSEQVAGLNSTFGNATKTRQSGSLEAMGTTITPRCPLKPTCCCMVYYGVQVVW